MTQNVITRHLEMLIRGEATAAYCISIAYESSIRNTTLLILGPSSLAQPQMSSCISQPSRVVSCNIGKDPGDSQCPFLYCSWYNFIMAQLIEQRYSNQTHCNSNYMICCIIGTPKISIGAAGHDVFKIIKLCFLTKTAIGGDAMPSKPTRSRVQLEWHMKQTRRWREFSTALWYCAYVWRNS
jgi:hypothetical protein